MRVQLDLVIGGDPKRSVRAVLDADPRTHLRDLLPLLHEALQQCLYEHSKPSEPLGDALRRTRVASRVSTKIAEDREQIWRERAGRFDETAYDAESRAARSHDPTPPDKL